MEEIERRAEGVLAVLPDYIWRGEQPPVPIEEIADSHFGLHVRDVSQAEMREAPGLPEIAVDESISGLLIPELGEIWVNSEEAGAWPTRRRFTIAHELGHHVLHRVGGESLFCRRAVVDPVTSPGPESRPPLPIGEQEANVFAAAILMPAWLVQQHYEHANGEFAVLCERFASSQSAMGRRLRAVVSPSASRASVRPSEEMTATEAASEVPGARSGDAVIRARAGSVAAHQSTHPHGARGPAA